MVSYYHQVYSHTLTHFSLTHSHIHVIPLTLPWCRPTTKSTHSLLWENLCSHSHFHGVVLPPSLPTHSHTVFSLTHTPMVSYYHQVITHPHQSLCSHSLPCPHTLCSPHFISPHSHHQLIPTHLPHSPTHHASIASSSLPITNHHLPPPIASSHSTQHS